MNLLNLEMLVNIYSFFSKLSKKHEHEVLHFHDTLALICIILLYKTIKYFFFVSTSFNSNEHFEYVKCKFFAYIIYSCFFDFV
jgi:hypothetical protein